MCSNITAQSLFSVFKCLVPMLNEAQLKKKKKTVPSIHCIDFHAWGNIMWKLNLRSF